MKINIARNVPRLANVVQKNAGRWRSQPDTHLLKSTTHLFHLRLSCKKEWNKKIFAEPVKGL
jgi:hypothetical protein